jgi:alpha-1,3-glucosyltransferase
VCSAQLVNPAYVALHTSRGLETPGLKLFMRATVMVADLLVLFPAAVLFVSAHYREHKWSLKVWPTAADCLPCDACRDAPRPTPNSQTYALAAVLLQPALIVIDHGHFQYNGVSLGLTIAAAALIAAEPHTVFRHVVASVLFTLALNYKQMSLYYALPFFAVLLGRILGEGTWRAQAVHLAAVGGAVVGTCLALWTPWLALGADAMLQMGHRVFPVARGLYEDKVGNVWCSISPAIKLKDIYSTAFLTRMCLASTLAACLPKMIDCLRNPTPRIFVVTLFNNALAFYLFSYHVHEVCVCVCVRCGADPRFMLMPCSFLPPPPPRPAGHRNPYCCPHCPHPRLQPSTRLLPSCSISTRVSGMLVHQVLPFAALSRAGPICAIPRAACSRC